VRRRSTRASTGRATRLPRRPWTETVIYEDHVKGFTKLTPAVREDLRGTSPAWRAEADRAPARPSASPPSSCCRSTTSPRALLHALGPDELLGLLVDRLLAPHAAYAATGTRGEQVREFKGMVKALHRQASR
jgi:glycogen operon protein